MANIQIPESLFYDILRYYVITSEGEEVPEELDKRVFSGLTDKVQKITDRELYTTYKTAPTEEEFTALNEILSTAVIQTEVAPGEDDDYGKTGFKNFVSVYSKNQFPFN